MKIALFSDIHYEHGSTFKPNLNVENVDLICLSGDIDSYRNCENLLPFLEKANVLMNLGNHDYYGNTLIDAKRDWKSVESYTNRMAINRNLPGRIKIVTNFETVIYNSVRFIVCTLWTDMKNSDPFSMMYAARAMSDFEAIINFTPNEWLQENKTHVNFIRMELDKPFSGKTVIMTHHMPSFVCVDQKYYGSPLNPAFANSQLEDLFSRDDINYWFHGHTHDSIDKIHGNIRILCNPHGYEGHDNNPNFKADFIINV